MCNVDPFFFFPKYKRQALTEAADVVLTVKGKAVTGSVKMTTIHSDDLDAANPPGNPTNISPQSSSLFLAGDSDGKQEIGGGGNAISLPTNSFTVFEVPL